MNWRDHFRRLLTLRCEESSLLASQELDEPLGTADRLALWGHLLGCRSCWRFRHQLRRISEIYRRRATFPSEPKADDGGLSPDSRQRIAEALRRAADNDPRQGG